MRRLLAAALQGEMRSCSVKWLDVATASSWGRGQPQGFPRALPDTSRGSLVALEITLAMPGSGGASGCAGGGQVVASVRSGHLLCVEHFMKHVLAVVDAMILGMPRTSRPE